MGARYIDASVVEVVGVFGDIFLIVDDIIRFYLAICAFVDWESA